MRDPVFTARDLVAALADHPGAPNATVVGTQCGGETVALGSRSGEGSIEDFYRPGYDVLIMPDGTWDIWEYRLCSWQSNRTGKPGQSFAQCVEACCRWKGPHA